MLKKWDIDIRRTRENWEYFKKKIQDPFIQENVNEGVKKMFTEYFDDPPTKANNKKMYSHD